MCVGRPSARVPWTHMRDSPTVQDCLIDPVYLPEGMTIKDPSKMVEADVHELLKHWRTRQNAADISITFRFSAYRQNDGSFAEPHDDYIAVTSPEKTKGKGRMQIQRGGARKGKETGTAKGKGKGKAKAADDEEEEAESSNADSDHESTKSDLDEDPPADSETSSKDATSSDEEDMEKEAQGDRGEGSSKVASSSGPKITRKGAPKIITPKKVTQVVPAREGNESDSGKKSGSKAGGGENAGGSGSGILPPRPPTTPPPPQVKVAHLPPAPLQPPHSVPVSPAYTSSGAHH